ncbi:glycosyltransferase 87 family protein [Pararhodonellum marinum]|uniref:glycosyltransferase 87 family protein n=1 Tax=Pararhodonellum marinum TaxID=2755358 RepID=UPI00188FDA24|nr:glycosyltransferase 87 family protein [Pararhodonellum marinum]
MKNKPILIGLLVFFVLLLAWLAYGVDRTEFSLALTLYSALFLLYLIGWNLIKKGQIEYRSIFVFGLLIRLTLLPLTPNWSDDYVRFFWDGEMLLNRENPYLNTPEQIINREDQDQTHLQEWFGQLNSPQYYSVYPPSNQLLFMLSAWIADGELIKAVITLRLLIILCEGMAFWLLLQLFRYLKLSTNRLYLYAFNPLVIMEITGNLHFEGLMLTFLLGGIFALAKSNASLTGIWMGLSVAVKLNPLMLFPAVLSFLRGKYWLGFVAVATIVIGICFGPLLIQGSYENVWQSIRLYQGKFEFNASIYYIFRQIGFWVKGYNLIGTLSPILSLLSLLGILWVSVQMVVKSDVKRLLEVWLIIYLIYFLLNPVIHPWYLIPPIAISILTHRIAFLAWSYLVFFSYQAYSNENFQENPLWLFLEYLGLTLALLWDYRPKPKLSIKTNLNE